MRDRSHHLATVGLGEVVGEMGVRRRRLRSADVVAGPDGLSGLALGGATLGRILKERPLIAPAMPAALAERLAAATPI